MSREPAQRYPDILAFLTAMGLSLATDDANQPTRGIALDLPATLYLEIDTVTLAKMALSSDALTAEETHILANLDDPTLPALRIVKPAEPQPSSPLATSDYPDLFFLTTVDLPQTIFPSCHIGLPRPILSCHCGHATTRPFLSCHIGLPRPILSCHCGHATTRPFPPFSLPLWTCQTYPFSWIILVLLKRLLLYSAINKPPFNQAWQRLTHIRRSTISWPARHCSRYRFITYRFHSLKPAKEWEPYLTLLQPPLLITTTNQSLCTY